MTGVVSAEVAELRAAMAVMQDKLERLDGSLSRRPRAARASVRRLTVGVALAGAAAVYVGLTGAFASPPAASTTGGTYLPLTPAKKVLSAVSIAAHGSKAVVVIAGSTTVPPNATAVALSLSAKGAAAGTLNIYPTGNLTGGSGQFLSWSAGQTVTGVAQENPGQAGELTFANSSTSSVTVTVTITGYTTQVSDGSISSVDGTAGQVLTNTGAGATWQTQGQAFGSQQQTDPYLPQLTFTTIDSVAVPAGSYAVSASVALLDTHLPDTYACIINSPAGNQVGYNQTATNPPTTERAALSVQGLLKTTGGTITLKCWTSGINASAPNDSLTATQVSSVNGTFAN